VPKTFKNKMVSGNPFPYSTYIHTYMHTCIYTHTHTLSYVHSACVCMISISISRCSVLQYLVFWQLSTKVSDDPADRDSMFPQKVGTQCRLHDVITISKETPNLSLYISHIFITWALQESWMVNFRSRQLLLLRNTSHIRMICGWKSASKV
jgi:hypothetical protein